jgi:hypothetical protein
MFVVVVMLASVAVFGQISYPAANDINAIAGTGTMGYNGTSGAATTTDLYEPLSAVFDASGNVWIDDGALCLVLEVSASTGDINSILGTVPTGGYYYDCVPTYGVTYDPMGAVVDASGNMYFIDGETYIRKRTSAGSLSVVAGIGTAGHTGDGGAATSAEIQATKLTIDSSGNLFFVQDQYTSTRGGDVCSYNTIREVATSGLISTVAGSGTCGYTGDGGAATSAEIEAGGLAVDSSDNVYITNLVGCALRKVAASNHYISTIAGNGTCGYSADGGAAVSAELKSPTGVAVDSSGNVYVADYGNYRIRMISASTQDISTIAGDGTFGCSGNGGAATSAELGYLDTLAIDGSGHLILTDTECADVRAVTLVKPTPSISLSCSPNPITYGGETTDCTVDVGNGATGTTTWTINGGAWTTQTLSGGTASAGGFNGYAAGSYTIGVTYNGDSNNNTASTSTTLTISMATPSVSDSCSPNPITYGGSNSICIGYASDSGTVTGTLSFTINGSPWATETLSSGSATAPQFSSTYGIGTYTVGVAYSGDSNNNPATSSTTLTISKAAQTITFPAPASPVTYGVAAISLSATASSGLAVTFSVSSGPCTVSGSTLTVTGAGTCVVAASQAGNADYSAAAQVTQSVTVNAPVLTVTAKSASRVYGVANPAFSYTVSGYVNGDTSSVVGGSAAETTSATSTSAPGSYLITFSSEALTAANYTFSYVNGTLTVTQASQTITFNAPASPVTYGVSPISLSATASSGLAVTFSVSSGPCTVSGGTLTVIGTGTCVVAANQAGNTDYLAAPQVTQSVTVNQAVLTVTANSASRVYGTVNPTFNYTITGYVNGDTSSAVGGSAAETTSATSTSAPGSYSITFSSEALTATNYTFSYVNGTLTVSQASQTITFNAPASPVTYGVSPISLSATASSGLAVTFSVSSGPCSASGATLTVTGAGTCVVAANQAGNADYTAAAAVSHSIVVNAAVLTVTANNALRFYGAANPTFTQSYSGFVNGDTSSVLNGAPSLSTTATSTSAPGPYLITAAVGTLAASNYTFSFVNGTLTVTAATQTISFPAPASPVTYGVSPISLNATASSGLAVTFSVSSGPCTVSGSTLTVTGAGTCVVAANQAGNSDYSAAAQVTQSVTVNQAALTVTANSASRVYGATNPTFNYTVTGYVNGDASSVVAGSAAETTSATSTSAPGSYSITFSSEVLTATNYTFIYVSGTLTVTQASQTITFNAPASPVTYGVSPISLSATTSSGLAVIFSVSAGPCSVSGSTLTVSGSGTCVVAANQPGNSDYSAAAQVTQSVTVNQAALTVTATNGARAYGAANPTFSYTVSGYVNGDTSSVVGGSAAETTSATSSSAPGSYSITFSSEALTAANYTFSYVNGTLTVTQASQTISFAAPASPVTYGVSPISLSATASSGLAVTFGVLSGPCAVSGSTLTVTGVGTCVVAANQAGNTDYSAAATVSHSIVVTAAVLTVTANNASRAYGAANPTFTPSYSGFVNGDTSSVLSGAPSLTTTATSTSAPGSYTITSAVGTLAASNYTFGFVNGTLTVNAAVQTISFTAPASPVTYGVSPIALIATASSGLAVTFSVSSGPCSVSGSTLTVTGAGSCVVAANQAGNADYAAASQVTQSVTVNQAALTVTASSASRAYGATNPALTYTITGYVNGDTSSVVGGSAAETTSATASSAPGSYAITFSSEALIATNYTFGYVTATLTVTQASQTITFAAPASPVTYGVSPISLSASASSGLAVTFSVSSGSCSVFGATLTVTGAGTCVVAANQAGNADYSTAATASHSIVVNAAVLTVTANNASRIYGTANPTFAASFLGFVNGDTWSVLSGAPSLTTTATPTSAPGSYTITSAAGTLAASNYTFSFANGTLTVTAATQTITFTAPVSPVTYGVSQISLSATVSSGLAVTFSVSSGPCTVSGNTMTVAGAGTCVVAANQPGNADYTAAPAVLQSLVINKESVIVNSTSSLSPSIYGDNVALTFTLIGGGVTPTGTLTISDGTNPLATISLDAGIATYNTSALIAGKHTLTAVYSGDNNYQ